MAKAKSFKARITVVSPLEVDSMLSDGAGARLQLVQERRLPGEDLAARLGQAEPRGAIDLGELLGAPRLRRPLHGEHVAADRAGVAVALERPGVDHLSARLPARRELEARLAARDARL